jgi:hypothetical protein
MTNPLPPQSSRKSTIIWGIVIGGLLLVNLILFGSFFFDDPQTVKYLRFSLDYRHWPAWYSVNLWLIVFGLVLTFLLKTERVQNGIRKFYASSFWRLGVRELQNSRWNKILVRQFLRRKFTKRILRRWIHCRKRLRVDQYHRYAVRFIAVGLLLVILRYSDGLAPVRGFFFYRTGRGRYLIQRLYEWVYLIPLTSYLATGVLSWRLFVVPVTGLLLTLWLLVSVRNLKKMRRTRHDR